MPKYAPVRSLPKVPSATEVSSGSPPTLEKANIPAPKQEPTAEPPASKWKESVMPKAANSVSAHASRFEKKSEDLSAPKETTKIEIAKQIPPRNEPKEIPATREWQFKGKQEVPAFSFFFYWADFNLWNRMLKLNPSPRYQCYRLALLHQHDLRWSATSPCQLFLPLNQRYIQQ